VAPATAPTLPAAPASAPVAAPQAPTPASTPLPFAEQLGARLTGLGGLAHGRHVLTVPVDPEHLGPVRVVAHIGPESVRVELVGGTEAAREALRGSLADLRRDLSRDLGAGLDVQVGVGGDAPSRERPDADRGPSRAPTPSAAGEVRGAEVGGGAPPGPSRASSGLDLDL
ncbi:flagellar hook-length control protein FliK, partial [Cellulomonas biazotea]